MDHEVIVVGAGPVGLSLALGLANAGRRVLVLEKEPTTVEHSRAPAIWPRTQEILSGLGVLDDFLARGIELPRVSLHDVDAQRIVLSIPVHELEGETPFPRLLILPQSRTERILRTALERYENATVLFSAEALRVEQDDSGVRVTFRQDGKAVSARGSFAVGCDGARSTVRDEIGAMFEGKTYATRAALADISPPGSNELPFPRLSTRDWMAVAIRIDERLWRLILPFTADEQLSLDRRVERAAIHLFPGVRSRADFRVIWQSEFSLHRKIASRFVEGRIALAGDAAHLNSPVGGQGMNAGIQDTLMLTDALLRSLESGEAGHLDDYGRKRRTEVNEGVNLFTDLMTRLLLLGRGRAVKPLLSAVDLALRIPQLRRRFLRRIAMLDAG